LRFNCERPNDAVSQMRDLVQVLRSIQIRHGPLESALLYFLFVSLVAV
jgi:hypothetical protein